jgi:hypothetical protein
MAQHVWYRFGVVAMLLATLPLAGCSGKAQSPISPEGATEGLRGANPDAPTLKVNAPVPLSPLDGERLKDRRPVFRFNNAEGLFVGASFNYEVQVLSEDGQVVYTSALIKQAMGGETTHTFPGRLEMDTAYRWHVRAVLANPAGGYSYGPWCGTTPTAFVTVDQPDLNPENMLAFIFRFSEGHPEWAACTAGDGVACHRFVRAVAQTANPGCDPGSWGLLSKNPGEWQCTLTACGSLSGEGYGEDIITYGGSSPLGVYDIIIGAGLPGAHVAWQDNSWTRRAGNEWACPW